MLARSLWFFGLSLLLAGCMHPSVADKQKSLTSEHGHSSPHSAVYEARSLYYFGLSRLLLEEGEYQEAAVALARAAAADPDSLYLRHALAMLFHELGEDEKARAIAEDALLRFGETPEILQLMGNLHFSRGDEQSAIDYFQRVIQIDPNREAAHLHLAISYARSERLEDAVALLRDFLQDHAESLPARLTLARLLRETGNSALAIAAFQEVLQQEPGFEPAVLELGSLYEERQELDTALQLYQETIAEHPFNLAIRHHLGFLLIQQNRLSEAMEQLQAIVLINPDDLDARRKIGLIQMELRTWGAAAQTFAEILVDHPELERVRFFLGSALERQEAWDEALAAFAGISAESELYDDAVSHISYLHYRSGRIEAAIATLEERMKKPGLVPENFSFLASLHEANDDAAAALAVLDGGTSQFPAHADLHYQRGLLHERRDDRQQALRAMREVIRIDADHAEALNFIAYAYAEQGENLDEALILVEHALILKDAPHIVDTLGWVYFKQGRLSDARQAIEAAAARLPTDATVLEHLADIYLALGLAEQAGATYRQVLELDPENEAVRQKLIDLRLAGNGR
jgi:tetratricopeptide (TPR) repeat protein